MRPLRWLLLGWLVVACGQEDVQLLPSSYDASAVEPTPDVANEGPPNDASSLETGADGLDAVDDLTRLCVAPASGRACADNGAACAIDPECCSGRCEGDTCLEPGTCAGVGIACLARSTCCSGRCESSVGSTSRACLNYCLPDGAACSRALDCCSMGCHAAQCGAPLCSTVGSRCTEAADCCSGSCSLDDGQCRDKSDDSQAACLATGESCSPQLVDGAPSNCCGACDATSSRCVFGPGPCLPVGSVCQVDSDCCRGTCAVGASGVAVCTAPCLADGTVCSLGADCCNHHCNGWPGACGPAVTCSLLGAGCQVDADCCSGQCLSGACGSNCQSE